LAQLTAKKNQYHFWVKGLKACFRRFKRKMAVKAAKFPNEAPNQ